MSARRLGVGYTSAHAGRPRALVVLLVLALVAGVAGGAWYWGRSSVPATAASDADAQSGAGGVGGGAASGPAGTPWMPVRTSQAPSYPNTTEGAGQALAAYLRNVFALSTGPRAAGVEYARRIVLAGAPQEQIDRLAGSTFSADRPGAVNQFVPMRVITQSEPDGQVRALVWAIDLIGMKTDGRTPEATPMLSWVTMGARLRWVDDGWRIVVLNEPQPGPIPATLGQPDTADRFTVVLAAPGAAADGP
ncbi:hypothetical protein [Embleya scabrispora]|uniref:hypothetical protein n=1 Tax=Embleya scabrispora TaxID=159449 RepID=UPI0003696D39|nr:hypothetical protein [Embleya scabrispora]MYS85435.1 hypothetical protein [Streptomyces sp. SID5474]